MVSVTSDTLVPVRSEPPPGEETDINNIIVVCVAEPSSRRAWMEFRAGAQVGSGGPAPGRVSHPACEGQQPACRGQPKGIERAPQPGRVAQAAVIIRPLLLREPASEPGDCGRFQTQPGRGCVRQPPSGSGLSSFASSASALINAAVRSASAPGVTSAFTIHSSTPRSAPRCRNSGSS